MTKLTSLILVIFLMGALLPFFTTTGQKFQVESRTVIDGEIDNEEYAFNSSLSTVFTFFWSFNETTITIGIEVETMGWIAIGIDPVNIMNEADMIFGWVESNGTVGVLDTYSTGTFGPHPPDVELGGTDDIITFDGSEAGGITVIEFARLLTTTDEFDKPISLTKPTKLIWAYDATDDYETKHDRRGSATIDFRMGRASNQEAPIFWPIHAVLMVTGLSLITGGMLVARYGKRRFKNWLLIHQITGLSGLIFGAMGLISAFVMVQLSSGIHFRVPHAFFGLFTLLIFTSTPILGFTMLRVNKTYRKQLRRVHRWLGRITITLMILTIFSGLIQALLF
jgi:hypothetical protein